jgi:hypothetical protein
VHEAEIDQDLRIRCVQGRGEHALYQHMPIADLVLARAIVALLGVRLAVGGHQHRYGPTKLGHAGGNLGHLVGVVGLGVAGISLLRSASC